MHIAFLFLGCSLIGLADMFLYKKPALEFALYAKKDSVIKGSVIKDLYNPRSLLQNTYVDCLSNTSVPCVVGLGPAGCGKTLFACQSAISGLRTGVYSKIVVTRPFVSVDQESMGFLPGSIEEKMSPWTRPIFDIFEMFYSKKEIGLMLDSSVIEMSPLAYMRGRTFHNTCIIADEMQNSSPNQMFMLLSRLGEGSRIMVTGDLSQSDLGLGNGLVDFLGLVRKRSSSLDEIRIVEMGIDDIQRSSFVRSIFELYSKVVDHTDGSNKNDSNFVKLNSDSALIPKNLYKDIL